MRAQAFGTESQMLEIIKTTAQVHRLSTYSADKYCLVFGSGLWPVLINLEWLVKECEDPIKYLCHKLKLLQK